MCPKPEVNETPTRRTRWKRARARFFTFETFDLGKRRHDPPRVRRRRRLVGKLLHQGVRDEGLSEALRERLERHLDLLWTEDAWQERFSELRGQLGTRHGALEVFDGLIGSGCYADLVVAGVSEVALGTLQRMPKPQQRRRARDHARRLAQACSALADENDAAVQEWPAGYRPVFDSTLTDRLRNEATRLAEWVEAFDLRHKDAVRPNRLTYFVAACNHVKDVTGTYREQDFAEILDGLGVKGRDEGVQADTIRKWRRRAATAARDHPNRPLVDRMREIWS